MSSNVSMKALLESGVHFGHRTNKWNPLMRPYIFTERNGIHIIDLQLTVKYLDTAYNVIRDMVAQGGTILFVGTKRQAQETIEEEAIRCGMPYVTERWLPGTLTNWTTIYARIMELERLEKLRDTGEINQYVKKEGLMIEREISRLLTALAGIRNLKRLPEMLFVIDVDREITAVHEANLKKVPIVALVDTNCDPSNVDYIIPANDDAIRAIKLLVAKVADAVLEGKAMRKEEVAEEMAVLSGEGDRMVEVTHGQIELEEEFDDEDLLGAATLAKLPGVMTRPEEKSEEPVEEPIVDQAVLEPKVKTEEKPAPAKKPAAKKEVVKPEAKAVPEEKTKEKPATKKAVAKPEVKAEEEKPKAKPVKKAAAAKTSTAKTEKAAEDKPKAPAKKKTAKKSTDKEE